MAEIHVSPYFFEKSSDKFTKCVLCPNNCILTLTSGSCGVRRLDKDGNPDLPFYGKISALGKDPIEKKPLYHFFPGKEILSVGFWGCNLKCPFCQNHHISVIDSSKEGKQGDFIAPEAMAKLVEKSGTIGLAYTYSEPLIHIEWVAKTAAILRAKGLKNVLVTNGYINPAPGKLLLENMDALNIDLKSGSNNFYQKELKGNISPVKDFIAMAAKKAHVEVTTLVIPGKNDTQEEIKNIASFLASIDRSIPYHLSCYHPAWKYALAKEAPPTSEGAISDLTEVASAYLDYVYPGNIGLTEVITKCPTCKTALVSRRGYHTKIKALTYQKIDSGNSSISEIPRCTLCGEKIHIVM